MQRYKKALLGNLAEQTEFNGEPTLVEFVKVELICPERPSGNIRFDFTEVILISNNK